MKKYIAALTVAIFCFVAIAQDYEMHNLLKIVNLLRVSDSDSQQSVYKTVDELLNGDKNWTMMNELTRSEGECKASERPESYFRLNRMLGQAENNRYGENKVKGDFLNGEDEHFNYSLFEKHILPGKAVRYSIKGRQGKQEFYIVPFKKKNGQVSASLSFGNKKVQAMQYGTDGTMKMEAVFDGLNKDDTLCIEVVNLTNDAISVVILNHNSRK